MPTARVTANTTAQTLWTTPKHHKGKLKALNIDNQSTVALTIRIQDVFTPDPSAGVATPTQQTIERVQITVAAGASVSLSEDSLVDAEFLGVVSAIANDIQAACVIIAIYEFE